MKITLDVSEKNEGTEAPWWVICDPCPMIQPDPYLVMMRMITGPFFSREAAEKHLNVHRHNFSERAVVYCASGCYSPQYDSAYREAEKKLKDGVWRCR
ncbi:MAG: hypothetical protein PVG39_14600 [Desulfobacteraceae bacterium]|jgi:hypothetical protein